MERDARVARGPRPFVFTNCFTGQGLEEVLDRIEQVIDRPRGAPAEATP